MTSQNWSVFWMPTPDTIEVEFFVSRPAAESKCLELMLLQVAESADREKNLDWEITLMEVKAQAQQIPFSGDWKMAEVR